MVTHRALAAPAGEHEPGVRRGDSGVRTGRKDHRAEFDEEQRQVFDLLRKWRGGAAREAGVPSYVVFTNHQLAEIVRRNPRSLAQLGSLRGSGAVEWKARRGRAPSPGGRRRS